MEVGKGIGFERIKRITGYLSNLKQFNNAKREEEKDRVKHSLAEQTNLTEKE